MALVKIGLTPLIHDLNTSETSDLGLGCHNKGQEVPKKQRNYSAKAIPSGGFIASSFSEAIYILHRFKYNYSLLYRFVKQTFIAT